MRTGCPASNEDRTRDLLLTKEMLCQLSYRGIHWETTRPGHSDHPRIWPKNHAHGTKRLQKNVTCLHVGESNPGRLRDRQKCYQLHQHGQQPPARIELATLRLLSACSARLSYRGKCSRPGSNWRPWDYETHALPTAPQELVIEHIDTLRSHHILRLL